MKTVIYKDGEIFAVYLGDEYTVEQTDDYYVQVKLLDADRTLTWCADRTLTYTDPSLGDLVPGDLVQVPLMDETAVGRVTSLGRDEYDGACRDVIGVYRLELLPE